MENDERGLTFQIREGKGKEFGIKQFNEQEKIMRESYKDAYDGYYEGYSVAKTLRISNDTFFEFNFKSTESEKINNKENI